MKHKPFAGVIPPHSSAKVGFSPPISDDEKPMLLTVTGSGAIEMLVDPDSVLLTNRTDKHAPFVLIVVPQNPSIGMVFDYIRQKLQGG